MIPFFNTKFVFILYGATKINKLKYLEYFMYNLHFNTYVIDTDSRLFNSLVYTIIYILPFVFRIIQNFRHEWSSFDKPYINLLIFMG